MNNSKKRILFVIPPYFNISDYIGNSITTILPSFTIPYGILSIDAFIKDNIKNCEVETNILDLNIEAFRIIKEKQQCHHSDLLNILKNKVYNYQPDIVGISALFNTSYNYLKLISTIIKKEINSVLIVAGGGLPTNLYKKILNECPHIDAICYGEGEIPIRDLVNATDHEKLIEEHQSWINRKMVNQKIPINSFVYNLDDIPEFDYSLVNLNDYNSRSLDKNYSAEERKREMSIHTSRGCPFNCVFCLPKGTLILTGDLTYKPIEQIKVGDILIGIVKRDIFISYERTIVLDTFKRKDRIYKIETMRGDLYSTAEHPWLSDHYRWRKTKDFAPGQFLRKVSIPIKLPEEKRDYKIGYIAGAFDGDGYIGHKDIFNDYGIYQSHTARLVGDYDMMDTVLKYSDELEFGIHEQSFNGGDWALNSCVITQKKYFVDNIEKIINKNRKIKENDEYKRGYLAGIYDAEGSWSRNNDNNLTKNSLRIYNQDERILNRVAEYLHHFGFQTALDINNNSGETCIRILGELSKIILFFTLVNPKVEDKKQQIFDYHLKSKYGYVQILDISPEDICDVYNLETTTGNFIADGYITHNCANGKLHGKKVRFMSVKKVVTEIKNMISKFGLTTLIIEDDHFLSDKKRAKEILIELSKFNIRIEFPNGLAVYAIDEEIGQLLKKAGATLISLGIESGSDYVLQKIINKPLKIKMIKPKVRILRKNNIQVHAFIVIGLPGEMHEHRLETLNMLQDVGFDWVHVFIAIPIVGSRLYNICIDNNYLVNNDMQNHIISKANIKAPGVDPVEIEDFAYYMNLSVNFVNNFNMSLNTEEGYKKAIIYFQNVVQKYPEHAFAHYFLAKTYEHMNLSNELIKKHMIAFTNSIKNNEMWKKYTNLFKLQYHEKSSSIHS